MIGHLFGVPAAADAKDEAAGRQPVDGGDLHGSMDWIALDDEADAGRELDPLCNRCRCAERDERIVTLVVVLRQLTTPWPWRLAARRNMAVLRQPDGLEIALLRLNRQIGRLYGIICPESILAAVRASSSARKGPRIGEVQRTVSSLNAAPELGGILFEIRWEASYLKSAGRHLI
jgi:hypothetical protein